MDLMERIIADPSVVATLGENDVEKVISAAFCKRTSLQGKDIHFYAPTFASSPYFVEDFPRSGVGKFGSISITGIECQLQCDHCKGTLLGDMTTAPTPQIFAEKIEEMARSGTEGILVSGGAMNDGTVPIHRFLPAIKHVKDEYNMEVVVHSGFLDEGMAMALKNTGIDCVMMDIVGSATTAKRVLHLGATIEHYERTIDACLQAGLPVMPHIVIGLDGGNIYGEYEAISMLSTKEIDGLVFVVLMPRAGTPFHALAPPPVDDTIKVILAGRLCFSDKPVILGCAKPHGRYKEQLESAAIRCGVDGIVYPLQETIEEAITVGLAPRFHETCCSLVIKHGRGESHEPNVISDAKLEGNR